MGFYKCRTCPQLKGKLASFRFSLRCRKFVIRRTRLALTRVGYRAFPVAGSRITSAQMLAVAVFS